ncbi:MAG: hypothetical protein ABII97_00330 [Patescibacteria group bacterium]
MNNFKNLKFLPSKKFITLLVIVLLMITVILVFNSINNKNGGVQEKTTAVTKNAITETDSDNDGLADWEEVLWKTDPKNPDTDGDGTSDGEEVRNNRNPAKPAPGDELTEEEIRSLNNPSGYVSPFDQISKTDDFTQKFLTQYLLQKSLSEGVLDDVAKEVLIKSVLGGTSLDLSFRTFSVSDIKISNTDDTATIKQYGNDMGNIIKKNDTGIKMEEILLSLKKAVETNNKTPIEKLKTVVEKNTQIINEAAKVSVPKSAVNIHIDFLNGMSRITEMILGMYKSMDDPLSGLVAIGNYQETVTELINVNKKINAYFDRKSVVYKSSDAGYVYANDVF